MAQNTLIGFENLEAVLNEYGEDVRRQYQANLTEHNRIASGELYNCYFNVSLNGRTYEVALDLKEYWKYVEYGRKPGKFPPTNKILEWITIKPVIPRPDASGRIPTPKQLAFLIGRKIANEGYEGSNDLTDANDDIFKRYEPKIVAALAKDLGSYMQRILIAKGV
jgi:hypothetical protein